MWIFYVIFSFMCHFINQVWIIAYLADWDKELGLCSFHLVEVKITFGHLWSPWTLCIREVLGKKRTKWNMTPSHQNHEFLIFLSPKVYKSQNYFRAFLETDDGSLILLKFPKRRYFSIALTFSCFLATCKKCLCLYFAGGDITWRQHLDSGR